MNSLEKYLTLDTDKPMLYRFALMWNKEQKIENLQALSQLAEPENWDTNGDKDYDILNYYLFSTFERVFAEKKLLTSKDEEYVCFNTGLMTTKGEEIICLFSRLSVNSKNPQNYWRFNSFKKESDRELMSIFTETPKVASYFENFSSIYFDPTIELVKNYDHIIGDNIDRFPASLREKGDLYIQALIHSAIDLTLKKIKRSWRIATPVYYADHITFLLPIDLDGCKMALAVELMNNRYRVNTIFDMKMAKRQARVIMKPEAGWL
jgi:hypothetical protein